MPLRANGQAHSFRGITKAKGEPPLLPVVPNPSTPPLHFQETFTSQQYLAYQADIDWDTTQSQLTLQRQDNIGQRAVVVTSSRVVGAENPVVYVVWQDLRHDSGDIYAQKLSTQGQRLWTHDHRVNSDDGAALQFDPTAVVDQAGNLLVVWVDDRNGNHDLYAQRLTPDGEPLWAEDLRVQAEEGTAAQGAPVLAATDADLTVVAWHDNREGDYNIYLQLLDANGTRQWESDLRANQDQSMTAQTDPNVALSGNGIITVAWLDQRVGNGDIYLQRFSSQGTPLWPQEVRVNQPTEPSENRPALAVVTSGLTIVGWLNAADSHLYFQGVDQQGQRRWHNALRANQLDQPANAERTPALLPWGNSLIIAWERAQTPALYAQLISDQGNLLWPTERLLMTSAGRVAANEPSLALTVDSQQRVVLAWSDQRNHATGDLYAQRIDQNGQRLWSVDARVDDAAGTVDQGLAEITRSAVGHNVVVWQDHRFGALPQLYFQHMMADGQPRWPLGLPLHPTGAASTEQRLPLLATVGEETLVLWQEITQGTAQLVLQRLDAAGNRLWPTPRLIDGEGATPNNPTLAITPQGTLWVAWEAVQGGTTQLALLPLNAQGEPQWTAPRYLPNPLGTPRLPALAVDHSGNAYLTWLATSAEGTDLYAQQMTAQGTWGWPAPILVNSAPGLVNRFNAPALATSADGITTISWVDNRQSGVYAQRLTATGQKLWTADRLLNTTPGTFSPMPALALHPTGDAIVVWQGTTAGTTVINAQRINAAGDLLWRNALQNEVTVSQGSVRAARPRLVIDTQGVSSIVWRDERRNNPDIFMQRLDELGNRSWPADRPLIAQEQFYRPRGTAESLALATVAQPIRQATLTASLTLHGGNATFWLTNDGATWQSAQLGSRVVFTTTGSDLRWRVQLQASPNNPAATPVLQAVHVDYYLDAPVGTADPYEGDDHCAAAQALQVAGAPQQHDLTAQGDLALDEDWLYFRARPGQRYLFWATPEDRDAALELRLYTQCGAEAAAVVQSLAGHSAFLPWTTPAKGNQAFSPYFVRVAPVVSGTVTASAAPAVRYQVGAREVITPGIALVVAGRLAASPVTQTAIDQTADRAYQKLLQQGYETHQITYLGRTTGVTQQAFQRAIQSWAVAQAQALPTPATPLLLYLVGRGEVDRFYLNETESITPALLNLWLSNLEAQTAFPPITVILEARQAGSFITTDLTNADGETLSAPNRVLITATSAQGSAWRTTQGLLFSDLFWSALAQGQTVYQSFQAARQAVQEAGYFCQSAAIWCQAPWFDDNGDGVPNGAPSVALAYAQGLAVTTPGLGPQLQTGRTNWEQATQTVAVAAQLVVSNTQTTVEAHFLPLPYQPTVAADEPFPALIPAIGRLTKLEEGPLAPHHTYQRYGGAYPLPTPGERFWVTLYAWDAAGFFAMPLGMPFQNKFYAYLPMVNR
ncbi:MAG: hypothetical protein KF832_05895 [Caldilineaceae bacterium]|nr:hypothetical protein [Caldilineaceae bacterium]